MKMFDDPNSWSYRFTQASLGGDWRPEFDPWPGKLIEWMRWGQQNKRGPFRLKLRPYRFERIEVHRVTYELNALNLGDAQDQVEYGPRPKANFRRISDEVLERDGAVVRYPELIAHWGYPYDAETGRAYRGSIPRQHKKG